MIKTLYMAGMTALLSVCPAYAFDLPTTQDGHYALGRRFAECSASLVFVAQMAREDGLLDTASLAEQKARLWRTAGLAFLASGLDQDRVAGTQAAFDTLVRAKHAELQARHVADPEGLSKAVPEEYDAQCRPLSQVRDRMNELLR